MGWKKKIKKKIVSSRFRPTEYDVLPKLNPLPPPLRRVRTIVVVDFVAVRTLTLTERLQARPSAKHDTHPGNGGVSEVIPMPPPDRPGGVAGRRNVRGQERDVHLRRSGVPYTYMMPCRSVGEDIGRLVGLHRSFLPYNGHDKRAVSE